MRVTSNTFPDSLIRQLQRVNVEMNALNTQAANGQRVNRVSDDSAAASRVLDMQEEKGRIAQFTRNAARAANVNNTTISQLQNFIDISDRAGEIATLADDLKGPQGLRAFAEEIDELLEHALQSANAKFNGEYIFGGSASGAPPFDANLDGSGKVADPDGAGLGEAVAYVGAAAGPEFHLSESGKVSPFTDGATNEKIGRFINNLVKLRDALQSGDGNAVAAAGLRDELETSEDDLILALSRQGSVQMRIEFDKSLNEQRFTDLEENISAEADVDLAQTIVRLTQVQNTYQASLQSAGRVLNTSLLQFI